MQLTWHAEEREQSSTLNLHLYHVTILNLNVRIAFQWCEVTNTIIHRDTCWKCNSWNSQINYHSLFVWLVGSTWNTWNINYLTFFHIFLIFVHFACFFNNQRIPHFAQCPSSHIFYCGLYQLGKYTYMLQKWSDVWTSSNFVKPCFQTSHML